ncbi:AAA family ATPase [Agrobacterium tumefaciens]|uniref:AAA family ATPase n=1 Tax=Agrobacterium tumefaciens TaxID=358 RepID=UPI002AFF5E96|nr:AAA family ATPase [Agrobacterium tumefaciens]MEA1842972.1 AAA family ATPase [Agrobacterium tumefaciens]
MATAFLIRRGRFTDADVYFNLVSEKADLKNSHISILAGQNGSGKSRILASIANLLGFIHNASSSLEIPAYDNRGFCRGLEVHDGETTVRFRIHSLYKEGTRGRLPERVLAISNLVSDRFHFQKTHEKSGFYLYLGARQSSNLMTTGAVERGVAEALLNMITDPIRLGAFRRWLSLVVPDTSAEIWISFPKLSPGYIAGTLQLDEARWIERVTERLGRRSSRAEPTDENVAMYADRVRLLFQGLLDVGRPIEHPVTKKRHIAITLDKLAPRDAAFLFEEFGRLMPYAQRLGFNVTPSVSFGSPYDIEFGHLSSGEQNILATGSKLVSYARPRSLILIDEPEVSLNVTWQQRYIELVSESLEHAPGSHVLIATHSPHLISNLPTGRASVVTVSTGRDGLAIEAVDARFEGWGSEAVLYQVLGITSASSNLFYKDLADALEHVQVGGNDVELLDEFLGKASKLDLSGDEPMRIVVDEIRTYRQKLQ